MKKIIDWRKFRLMSSRQLNRIWTFSWINFSFVMILTFDVWPNSEKRATRQKTICFNRYTADKKSSLHGWRGAWAPFRYAQLFSVINIFKTFTYWGFTEYLLIKIKFNFWGFEFCFVFYYVLPSIKGKREFEWRRNATYGCIG